MGEIFDKRMKLLMKDGSPGMAFVNRTNLIENKTFKNDQNYRNGMLYDWEMNEIEKVDFKFEKIKTFSVSGYEVEYMIHFRPDFNIESRYKDLFFKKDGRERLGFYIDVYDYSKKKYEKWMIVGKDDRVAFDRYNALKCNWCLEWLDGTKYRRCVCVVRDAFYKTMNTPTNNTTLGGSTVRGDLTIYVPSSRVTSSLQHGMRFMVMDSADHPRVFTVVSIADSAILGVTKLYLEQSLYNSHTDFFGYINDVKGYDFIMDMPLEDLPDDMGGSYHMICDCVRSSLPQPSDTVNLDVYLSEAPDSIYVHGDPVTLNVMNAKEGFVCDWHIFIDNVEYQKEELSDYFTISVTDTEFKIQAINDVMVKYIVKISIYDEDHNYSDSVEMEVRI